MKPLEIIEMQYLSEFAGMSGVTRIIDSECNVRYYANFKSFDKEYYDLGGHNYRFNHKNGILEFIDSKQKVLGKYAAGWGFDFTHLEKPAVIERLFFYDSYYGITNRWYRVYNDKLAEFPSIKVWHTYRTIFDGVNYYVVDNNGNYIIPPGKYDYIDGFRYGYARVMRKNQYLESPKDSGYRCGIIDTHDNIILPIEYTHIDDFFSCRTTCLSICEGGLDCDKLWQNSLYFYKFDILTKEKTREGDCYYGCYHDYTKESPDYSDEYSIWDALDGEAEAAGNIDYEW